MTLTLTRQAATALRALLETRDHESEVTLRLRVDGEGPKLDIDSGTANGQAVKREDNPTQQ